MIYVGNTRQRSPMSWVTQVREINTNRVFASAHGATRNESIQRAELIVDAIKPPDWATLAERELEPIGWWSYHPPVPVARRLAVLVVLLLRVEDQQEIENQRGTEGENEQG